jgi:hypothetical protein
VPKRSGGVDKETKKTRKRKELPKQNGVVHPWQRKRGRNKDGGHIFATMKREEVAKNLLRHHPKTLLNIPPPMLQFQDSRTTNG